MKAEALKVPIEGGDKWRLRLMATAAALVLGTAIYLLQRMPAAETLSAPDDQLTRHQHPGAGAVQCPRRTGHAI